MQLVTRAAESTPLSALFWWIIPITALVGAVIYVIWVTRFQKKYENQTERSVGKFKRFQDSFKKPE
jgi:CHASE2 domain-containing sensor protein